MIIEHNVDISDKHESLVKVYSKGGRLVLWWAFQKYICFMYFVIKFIGHSFYYNNETNIFSIMKYYLGNYMISTNKKQKTKKSTELIFKFFQSIWRFPAYIYNELTEVAATATLVLLQ
jgi:hypothetical protein